MFTGFSVCFYFNFFPHVLGVLPKSCSMKEYIRGKNPEAWCILLKKGTQVQNHFSPRTLKALFY